MKRLKGFSEFRMNESEDEKEFTLAEIERALDFISDDFVEIFFVYGYSSNAIECTWREGRASSGLEIDGELSGDPDDYSVDYDIMALRKSIKWGLKEVESEAEVKPEGPTFSLAEIMSASKKILDGGEYNYVTDIETADAWVEFDVRVKTLDGEKYLAVTPSTNEDNIKITGADFQKFREDLIKELIKNVIGGPEFQG